MSDIAIIIPSIMIVPECVRIASGMLTILGDVVEGSSSVIITI